MSGKYTAAEVGAAVALAVVSAEGWHNLLFEVVKRKLGLSNGSQEQQKKKKKVHRK